MNKHFKTYITITAVFISGFLYANTLTGKEADKVFAGSVKIITGKYSSVPDYIEFREEAQPQFSSIHNFLRKNFNLGDKFGLKLISQENDQLGFTHYRYQQTIAQIPVQNTMYIVHVKNGKVKSMNGQLVNAEFTLPTTFKIEDDARKFALNYVGASKYKWEIPSQEKKLQEITGNPNATYFPYGTLMLATENGKLSNPLHLVYRFDVYAAEPVSRQYIFVDVVSGDVIYTRNRMQDVDALGTAHTQYSGIQTITTDNNNGTYRLREAARGNGIRTYNAQQSTNPNNTDFTDADNDWNNVNANLDQYATDAHFASEMTYDFFYNNYGRNSLDDNGVLLISYVHYDQDLDNAYWDGQAMNYGDGSSQYGTTPYTTLDIGGHEITHGLTQYTADLDYQDESGALNESFSDCMGISIRQYAMQYPTVHYLIGDDNGNAFRSMANPKSYGQPDTYEGGNWYVGTQDNGGVHTNSGVQNHWFYILAHGEWGANDNLQQYNIAGIGIDKAAAITFRNLTVYMTNTSVYTDAREGSIQAAIDLYGACSPEVIATTNSWYAVGVGDTFSGTVVADFTPAATIACSTPATINFSNTSSNANVFSWNFGDNSGATTANPSHTYNSFGTYTVTLYASSAGCGSDSVVQTNVININDETPEASDVVICGSQTATLNATGSAAIEWYDAATAGNLISAGANYTTPALSSSATYYVQNVIGGGMESAAPANHNFGSGGYNNYAHYTIFNNTIAQTLTTVDIDAGAAGNRTIQLRDASNAVIATTTVNLTSGLQTVTLNFELPVANGLRLGVWTGTVNLYRNSAGANYPYVSSDGSITIISNDVPDLDRFYFFYNWQLQKPSCISNRKPVNVTVLNGSSTFNYTTNANTVTFTAGTNGATSYNWNFGDNQTSSDQNPVHTYIADGTYDVTLVVSNGNCSDTVRQSVNVNVSGVQTINGLSEILLVPNPANSFVEIMLNTSSSIEHLQLSVRNVLGETVYNSVQRISSGKNSLRISLNDCSAGVYFVSLQNGTQIVSKKFIKE